MAKTEMMFTPRRAYGSDTVFTMLFIYWCFPFATKFPGCKVVIFLRVG